MQRSHVRRGATGLLTALAVALTGCGGDDPTSPGTGGGGGGGGGGTTPVVTTSVTVQGSLSFSPADIQVAPGATVTWTWASGAGTHNVTFPSASINDSGNQDTGTFSAPMPTTPGTYSYSCTLHSGMNGSVLVM